ncbi:MAG: arsenosugar biosynthesis radical SAM (seleno)protein ArsS [Candidatus Binatus sp.]|jgi:radical SAM/Cys-rich protein|uniref:arsenosugar biosynthesis radical SAM (seleno)protein ArsS n=1 Tax=Candidatus Binatus sp. TaxID=2811406 RepID=UPI003CAC1A13
MAARSEALSNPDFDATLARHGIRALSRKSPATIQVNVGKLCNQACHHCHVDAGPRRTEQMTRATAARVLEVLAASPRVATLDITGGAPELNPNFAMIVERARALGRKVIVRCNLTVTQEPGMEWLVDFYRRSAVELVCSLPCYTAENTDRQRGAGVFDKSIAALNQLNAVGFGSGELRLDLVYNPVGASLPPPQAGLEAQYRDELARNFGIVFDSLLTIANMPIARFANQLRTTGNHSAYMSLLVNHFNPATVDGLMCRSLVSVGWDGRLYDCDFNQMLEIPLAGGAASTIWDLNDNDVGKLAGARIATGSHCFGCTAGAGSSCGGAIA